MPDQVLEIAIPDRQDPVRTASLRPDRAAEKHLRGELRRQIALLERRLGELFAVAFPRQGIEFGVAGNGGPRVLGVAELERVRDALALRLRDAEAELARRGRIEERNRARLEAMIEAPEQYRWLRITAHEIGEPSCRAWVSEPRYGLLGMLMGWWRVKVSSGCPLASGHGLRPARTNTAPIPSIALGSQIAKAPPPARTQPAAGRRGRSRARGAGAKRSRAGGRPPHRPPALCRP